MSGPLVIAVLDGNGKIMFSQPYEEFQYGRKNIDILNYYTGQKLFDILYNDLGIIQYEDNKLALKYIIDSNLCSASMKLLGKVAEAVIVKNCKKDEEINKKWLSVARRKKTKITTAQCFTAIGTGLLSTRRMYPTKYNPTDPQRDVIWINQYGKIAMSGGSTSYAGTEAGLQVKVSKNGAAYFLNDILNIRYEIPVVYFDINNDFDEIANKIYLRQKHVETFNIGIDFVKASAIDNKAYDEVAFYADLIEALILGKLTPEQLINMAENENMSTLKNAILSTSLAEVNITNFIQ